MPGTRAETDAMGVALHCNLTIINAIFTDSFFPQSLHFLARRNRQTRVFRKNSRVLGEITNSSHQIRLESKPKNDKTREKARRILDSP